MSLRKKAEARAKETAEATKKIGFIGQIILTTGMVPRLYEDWQHTDDCFVEDGDKTEKEVREEVTALVKKYTNRDNPDLYTCVAIKVAPDTSLSPNSRYNGGYVSTEPSGTHPRTHKRYSDFLFDHMSPELEENAGKKVWVHISWNRLTPDYGGDLTLLGDDARNDWGLLLTYLPTKKDATDLAKALRLGTTTMDEVAMARGYDATGVRKQIAAAAKGKPVDDGDSNPASVLSGLGEVTKKHYLTLKQFLGAIDFFEKSFKNTGNDIDATAKACGADPGDVAVLLNQPDYFRNLIEATGLTEQEAIAQVTVDTGMANGVDLAAFLGEDIPF